MDEIPWQNVITANLVALIIVCATVLAYIGVANWHDVFTLYLIVLAGLGFMASGVYYGQAKAYRDVFTQMLKLEKEKHFKETQSSIDYVSCGEKKNVTGES